MEFLILFLDRKDAGGAPAGEAALADYARQLAADGRLLRSGRLAGEAEGVRVTVHDGRSFVTRGPFADDREVLGGFWVLDAPDREVAIAIARRAFDFAGAGTGAVDVHAVARRYSVAPDPGAGRAYFVAFHHDPFLTDPGEAKLAEMVAYGEALARDGRLFETSPLVRGAPARIEARGGRTLVTEGPFAEAKEIVGGYTLMRVATPEAARAIAERYPHARWGTVELREIVASR